MKNAVFALLAIALFSPMSAFAGSEPEVSPILCTGDGAQVWAGQGLVDGETKGRTTLVDGSDKAVFQDVEAHELEPLDGVDRFEVKFGGKTYIVVCTDVSIEV